jgi:hypothetical protein
MLLMTGGGFWNMICSCHLVTDSEFCSHGTRLGSSWVLSLCSLFYSCVGVFCLMNLATVSHLVFISSCILRNVHHVSLLTVSSSFGNLKHLVENRVFDGHVIKHKYSLSIPKNETPALALIFQNAHHFFFSFLGTPNEYLPNTCWISHKYLFIYVVLIFFCCGTLH